MCFEVIRQGDMPEVLPAMEAIQLFPPDSTSNWNKTMTELYKKYGVIGGPQVCIFILCINSNYKILQDPRLRL